MSERWREMQAAAERLEEISKRMSYTPGSSHDEAEKLRRDVALLREEAKRQRDQYVRWLWGY